LLEAWKVKRVGDATERWRGQSRRRLITVDEVGSVLRHRDGLTRREGSRGPLRREPGVFGRRERVRTLGSGRVEDSGRGRRKL